MAKKKKAAKKAVKKSSPNEGLKAALRSPEDKARDEHYTEIVNQARRVAGLLAMREADKEAASKSKAAYDEAAKRLFEITIAGPDPQLRLFGKEEPAKAPVKAPAKAPTKKKPAKGATPAKKKPAAKKKAGGDVAATGPTASALKIMPLEDMPSLAPKARAALLAADIATVGGLVELVNKSDQWFRNVPGVSEAVARRIEDALVGLEIAKPKSD